MKKVLITTAAVIWALLAAVSVPVNAAETTTVAGTVLKLHQVSASGAACQQ